MPALVCHPSLGILRCIVRSTPTDCTSRFENAFYAAASSSESGNEIACATDSCLGFSDIDYHHNTIHLTNSSLKHPIPKSPRSCWTAAAAPQAPEAMAMSMVKATATVAPLAEPEREPEPLP